MNKAEKLQILVVDDESQVLIALEDLLSDEFAILKSSSPTEALEVMRTRPDIAVVLTDQRMPAMTGDRLLAHAERVSQALGIMITGFADLNAVVRAVNEGRLFAYVTKPWDSDDLRFKVHQAAERFRLTQELAHERRLLHDLMDNVPDGIYFKDREQKLIRANTAYAKSVGLADTAALRAPENEAQSKAPVSARSSGKCSKPVSPRPTRFGSGRSVAAGVGSRRPSRRSATPSPTSWVWFASRVTSLAGWRSRRRSVRANSSCATKPSCSPRSWRA
jgi:FixJ family two-component response regulator